MEGIGLREGLVGILYVIGGCGLGFFVVCGGWNIWELVGEIEGYFKFFFLFVKFTFRNLLRLNLFIFKVC